MKIRSLNYLLAAAGFALAVAMFMVARSFPERATSASRYVLFLSCLLGVLSIILPFERTGNRNRVLSWIQKPLFFWKAVVMTVMYVFALPVLGFFLSSGLYMLILSWLLGLKRPVWVIGGTFGLLLFIYVVFVRFLTVPVPMGIWGA
jgi:hypothetical protein